MILWPKARRSVSTDTATEISEAARQHGAEPVAVFVDEDFSDIVRCCKAAGIRIAQLHGKGARASLPDLPNWLEVSHLSLSRSLSLSAVNCCASSDLRTDIVTASETILLCERHYEDYQSTQVFFL